MSFHDYGGFAMIIFASFPMGSGAGPRRRKSQEIECWNAYFQASPLFEIARVLVCLDHVARFIVNANHSIV